MRVWVVVAMVVLTSCGAEASDPSADPGPLSSDAADIRPGPLTFVDGQDMPGLQVVGACGPDVFFAGLCSFSQQSDGGSRLLLPGSEQVTSVVTGPDGGVWVQSLTNGGFGDLVRLVRPDGTLESSQRSGMPLLERGDQLIAAVGSVDPTRSFYREHLEVWNTADWEQPPTRIDGDFGSVLTAFSHGAEVYVLTSDDEATEPYKGFDLRRIDLTSLSAATVGLDVLPRGRTWLAGGTECGGDVAIGFQELLGDDGSFSRSVFVVPFDRFARDGVTADATVITDVSDVMCFRDGTQTTLLGIHVPGANTDYASGPSSIYRLEAGVKDLIGTVDVPIWAADAAASAS